ncbi:MAG: hypothetical protein AAF560_03970 [Acidobacteriota bacterium]
MIISGLNQEVTVLGRTFHFQTELTRKPDLHIRTEVFVGGKVVATREHQLLVPPPADEEAVRSAMKEQHKRVIESTLQRAKRYQDRRGEAPASTTSQPAPHVPNFDIQQARNLGPPSSDQRAAVASAIRIRRIFGKFRLRLGLGQPMTNSEIAERLETAARGFAWIKSSPTFEEIRLDEQMRCHLVGEQVDQWLAGDRNLQRAKEIWSGIVRFNDYVTEINHRAELVEFDHQLLMWTAFQVRDGGMSDAVLDHLQWLSGRSTELDRLLDKPQGVSDETWFTQLCDVLTQLPSAGN